MRIILRDIEPELVLAWTRPFGDYKGVSFGSGSILDGHVDAVVSPANSYGYMDGGIDLIYRNFFGLQIENRVRKVIEDRYNGKLPIGAAFLVPTGHARIRRLVVAPTMETPRIIKDTNNAYVATKAALEAALKADPPIENLGIPGMGTGIGQMDFDECARQMCRAFVEVMSPVKVED